MSDLQLISHHLCPYVQRAAIVLSEKNIDHKRTYIDLSNKPDWFAKISPLGKVPILDTGDAALFESQVIAEYLDEVTPGSLHPVEPIEKARHRSWIEFGSETLAEIGGFYSAKDEALFEQKGTNLKDKFARIDQEITGPLFDGETFHLIDGVWGTIFRYFDVFDQIENFHIFSESENVKTWRSNIAKRPSVINAVPDGYPERLKTFLGKKQSYLAMKMR